MSKEKKRKVKNGLGYLLLALMILTTTYAYNKDVAYNELEDLFRKEKKELRSELNGVISKYKKIKSKNKTISKKLRKEMKKAMALKRSLSKVEVSNYHLLSKYRKRIAILEKHNILLVKKNKSLEKENTFLAKVTDHSSERLKEKDFVAKNLKEEKDSLEEEKKSLKSTNSALKASRNLLARKVALASILKVSSIDIVAMKERWSGKLTTTSRSRKTDVFKVNFRLLENNLAKAGQKNIYIQILDDKGKVLSVKGETRLVTKKTISYSNKVTVNYNKNPADVLTLTSINKGKLESGRYKVNVYIDGRYMGSSAITLK